MRRKRGEEPVIKMNLDSLLDPTRKPKPRPCVNCGKLCANWIMGELRYPYCSDDCRTQAGDFEPVV